MCCCEQKINNTEMKKLILITGILFTALAANTQTATYTISKKCYRSYDKDSGVFRDWSAWEKATGKESDEDMTTTFETFMEVAASGIKITESYKNTISTGNEGVSIFTYMLQFRQDFADADFSFSKEVNFEEQYYDRWKRERADESSKSGQGKVYSKTTLQQLLSGSFKGDIYFLFQYDNGKKRMNGYRIE
jgi:hypothetical protein